MTTIKEAKDQINSMKAGEQKWFGNGMDSNTVKSLLHLLETLEAEGELIIRDEHRESTSGHRNVDRIKIEKL